MKSKTIICVSSDVIFEAGNLRQRTQDWDEFYENLSREQPNEPLIEFLNVLSDYYSIIVYSQCPERYRLVIEEWLMDNDVNCDQVLLRADNSYTSDMGQSKIEILEEHFNGKAIDKIAFLIDNRNIDVLIDNGFEVLQYA